MSIRVLIIDDSRTMQAILNSRLSKEDDMLVVGMASNAAEGRNLIKELNPDVITLDIEMPGMNGLDFLEKIMALRPTPVIIVSGASQEGSAEAVRALSLGAIGCYAKDSRSGGQGLSDDGQLAQLVREASQVRFVAVPTAPKPVAAKPKMRGLASNVGLIAIGSSTGGVEALQTVLADYPADCPPTVIVQHINARFASAIAKTLNDAGPARVQLAESDAPLERGNIYLAPGDDKHLTVTSSSNPRLRLRKGPPVSGHLPSADMLFNSVAKNFGRDALGILLTGMGRDGADGLLEMKKAGAVTIAQDEATSIVFGMPRAAIELNAAKHILPVHKIAQFAMSKIDLARAG